MTNVIEKLPIKNIRYVDEKLQKFLKASGLFRLDQNEYYLYGSFIRSLWTNEKYNNVNIAFKKKEYLIEFQKNDQFKRIFESSKKEYSSVEQIIYDTDFTICQLVYWNGCIYHIQNYFNTYANRIIQFNITNNYYYTFLRVLKYIKSGYTVDVNKIKEIIPYLTDLDNKISNHELLFHSGGAVQPFLINENSKIVSKSIQNFPEISKSYQRIISTIFNKDILANGIYIHGDAISFYRTKQQNQTIVINASNKEDYNIIFYHFLKFLKIKIINQSENISIFENHIQLSNILYNNVEDLLNDNNFINTGIVLDTFKKEISYLNNYFEYNQRKYLALNSKKFNQLQEKPDNDLLNTLFNFISKDYFITRNDLSKILLLYSHEQ